MSVYYNEFDPKAAAWLRELIKEGHIADGVVDERSITDVKAHELTGFNQHHFFAGIGGWSLALRIAGIGDDEEWCTASCPCQPFSQTGKQMGNADSRHLFPAFRKLVARFNPARVIGEQVASKLGREWLARVRVEMATLGYATRGSDLCSAGIGSPNIRQRLYWLADTDGRNTGTERKQRSGEYRQLEKDSEVSGMGHTNSAGSQPGRQTTEADRHRGSVKSNGNSCYWDSFDILHCTDGKARRIEPGSFPLAHGISHRVGKLRGYGNAINPYVAAAFLKARKEDDRGSVVTEEDWS